MKNYSKEVKVRAAYFGAILTFIGSLAQLQAKDNENKHNWEGCREVWFHASGQLLPRERFRLFLNFQADRELSEKELDCILKAGDYLIEKRNDRYPTALYLGDFGHMYGLPPLIAVLRDTGDNPHIRAACIESLSRISDGRVVEPLIEILGEREPTHALAQYAFERLNDITHARIDAPNDWDRTPSGSPERSELQAKWREWWRANREKITLDRSNAFNSY